MNLHTFDPEIAVLVGMPAAVIYQNIRFWIAKNEANGHNYKDGRYWTYNSIAAFKKLFPYLSEKQVRTALDRLIESGLILKACHSDDKYDRTSWYTLSAPICPDGKIDQSPGADDGFATEGKGLDPEGKSIRNRYKPDIKPYPPQVAASGPFLDEIWQAYPVDRRRNEDLCRAMLQAACAEASPAQILRAVEAYANETANYTRSKVSFSDNWLREGRWRMMCQRDAMTRQADETEQSGRLLQVLRRVADWAKSGSEMCRHISEGQLRAALELGLISTGDAEAARAMR